jgi:phage shock protein PspC (stress-responsive transcriptional regulator)
VDPNLIRIAATLGLFTLTSTTILAYLIAWVIVPRTWRD